MIRQSTIKRAAAVAGLTMPAGTYHAAARVDRVTARRVARISRARARAAVTARAPFDVADVADVYAVASNATRRFYSWLYAGRDAAPLTAADARAAVSKKGNGGASRHMDISRGAAFMGKRLTAYNGDVSRYMVRADGASDIRVPADAADGYPVAWGISSRRDVPPTAYPYATPADARAAMDAADVADAAAVVVWARYIHISPKKRAARVVEKPVSSFRIVSDTMHDAADYIHAAAASILDAAPVLRVDAYRAARRGIKALDRQYNRNAGRNRDGRDAGNVVTSWDALTAAAADAADALTATPAADFDNPATDATPAAVERDAADVDTTPAAAPLTIDRAPLDIIDAARPAVDAVAAAAVRFIWDAAAVSGGRGDAVRPVDIARAWVSRPADAPAAVADIVAAHGDGDAAVRRVARRVSDALKKLTAVDGLRDALTGAVDARPARTARRDFDAVNRRTERAALTGNDAPRRRRARRPAPVAVTPAAPVAPADVTPAAPVVSWTRPRPTTPAADVDAAALFAPALFVDALTVRKSAAADGYRRAAADRRADARARRAADRRADAVAYFMGAGYDEKTAARMADDIA